MNLVSWNCQGLGNPKTVRALHSLVKLKGPTVLFLMETKLSSKKMEIIRVKVGFDYAFTVPSVGRSGGLALLWKQEVDVSIRNFSQHHIDAHMESIKGFAGALLAFMASLNTTDEGNHGHSLNILTAWTHCLGYA